MFHEVRFPTKISYGSQGGPGFKTTIVETDSGSEARTSRWSSARRKYDAAYGVKSVEDLVELQAFYLARQGPAIGFRYWDPLDYSTASDHRSAPASTDVLLGIGDGTTTVFQLKKLYTSGTTTKTRNITKPVTGSTLIALDGTTQATGWSVDTTTGLVTITPAPGAGVEVTGGCEFDVPVRFGSEIDDVLTMTIQDFDQGESGSIPLVELKDGLTIYDVVNPGGGTEVCMTADQSLSLGVARAWVFSTATAGLSVILPDETNVPTGAGLFSLFNSGTQDLTLKTGSGATVATLASGTGLEVSLTYNSLGAKEWYAI